METAINIGFSCNLLQKSMILIVIQATTMEECLVQLKEALSRFWDQKGQPKFPKTFALVIDGASLKFGLEFPCKSLLLEIGCRCKAVLCCRVSPLQKALVVRLVRNGLVYNN
jgi:phospholipid-translocating ATPase